MSKERGKTDIESHKEGDPEQTEETLQTGETVSPAEVETKIHTPFAAGTEQENDVEDSMESVLRAGREAELAVVASEKSQKGPPEPATSDEKTYELDPAAYDLPKEPEPSV